MATLERVPRRTVGRGGGARAYATLLALGAAILMAGIGWHLLTTPPPSAEQQRLELQQQRVEAQARQQELALDRTWAPWVAAAWHLTEILVLLAAPGTLLVGAAIAWHRRGLPTRDGRLPRPSRLDMGTWLQTHAAWLTVRHAQVTHPPMPRGLMNFSVTNAQRVTAPPKEAVEILEPKVEAPPRFGALLAAGELGPGRPILYGYATTGQVRHEGDEASSVLIAGQPKNGKSNTQACLAAQHALSDGQLLVCDPHAGNHRSLQTRLAPLESALIQPVANSPQEILNAVRLAHDELQERKARASARRQGDPQAYTTPERLFALVIDEWTALLRGEVATELPPLLANIVSEGAKFDLVAILAAQQWSADAVGGPLVRNVVPTVVAHRCRGEELRMVSGLRAEAVPADSLTLEKGEAYMLAPGLPLTRIRVPILEAEDLIRVGRLVSSRRSELDRDDLLRNCSGTTPDPLRSCSGPAPTPTCSEFGAGPDSRARAASPRILDLLRTGSSVPEIVADVYGVHRGRGTRYAEATAEVMAVIRDALPPPLTVVSGAQDDAEGAER